MHDNNTPEMEFEIVGPNQIIEIIKLLKPKNSLDIDKLSTNLI